MFLNKLRKDYKAEAKRASKLKQESLIKEKRFTIWTGKRLPKTTVAGYKRQSKIIVEAGCSLGPIDTNTIITTKQTTLTKEKAKAKVDYD